MYRPLPPLEHYTPETIIPALKAGDQRAFAELYEAYFPILCCYVRKILTNHRGRSNNVEDVVQETFLALTQKIDSFIGEHQKSLDRWLIVATKNNAFTIYTKQKEDPSLEDWQVDENGYELPETLTPEELLGLVETEEVIKECLHFSSPELKDIADLMKEGLSQRKIAQELGLTKQQVSRKEDRIKDLIKKRLGDFLSKGELRPPYKSPVYK